MFGWFKKKKTQPVRMVQQPTSTDDGLATSIAIGYAMNDGIVGGIIGGNIAGGLIGDAMNTSEIDRATPEAMPASDSGWQQSDGGYNAGSSYDSGCSGGFD
jgi:hypothetical protein